MAFKVFLDINILVDLLDAERANHKQAVALINEAEASNCYAFVTESVLNTTSYLVRKDYSPGKIKPLFSHLLSFVELIPINTVMYLTGLQMAINDVEDAILYTAALQAKVDFFITNDLKDLQRLEVPSLPIIGAKHFLSFI